MRRHAWAWNEGSILTLRNAARVGERAHHPLLCKDCLSCGYALPTPPLDNVVPAKRPGRRYELAHADQFIVQRIELGCPCAHARHSGEPGRGRGRHQRRVELGEEKAVDPPKGRVRSLDTLSENRYYVRHRGGDPPIWPRMRNPVVPSIPSGGEVAAAKSVGIFAHNLRLGSVRTRERGPMCEGVEMALWVQPYVCPVRVRPCRKPPHAAPPSMTR